MTETTLTGQGLTLDHRPFATLGSANHGWLDAHHHFSFANYLDRRRMRLGAIRVWKDRRCDPASTPAFRDAWPVMIWEDYSFTYVREGAITHQDSLGNKGRTEAGDVQVMSAGTGIMHSEINADDALCRLFQIWVMPRTRGIAPRWDQRRFPQRDGAGLALLASGYGEAGALALNADARLFGANAAAGTQIEHDLRGASHAYLVPASGKLRIGEVVLEARDGLAIAGRGRLVIEVLEDSELVMVETP
ncbi:MAG: pirin family protein [Parasphingorhabdus sp.]|nr:pirin family protein [Parasphingorhabdus sp.]